MNATPYDFPGLVSDASQRRFLHRERQDVIQTFLRETRARRMWERIPYAARDIARRMGMKMSRHGRKAAVRLLIALRRPLPRSLGDVDYLNREAFARHASRTYPGRITLLLSAADLPLYTADPVLDWMSLALGYDIHHVPGADADSFTEPGVKPLAELLGAALRAART